MIGAARQSDLAAMRAGRWPPRQAAGWAVLALALLFFSWESRAVRPQIDDAYISYRYARNLLEGNGLVFNPGERVEGFTNLSWTLAVAGGLALGLDAPLAGHLLGTASGLATLWATFALASTVLIRRRRWLAGVAALIVLASSSFATWALSGLETPLFAALATSAFVAQARGRLGWAACACAAATLTRPEGVLLAASVFACQLIPLATSPRRLAEARRVWLPIAGYSGVVALLTVFRVAYYGDPLPNTFYAKVGGIPMSRGVAYFLDFMRDGAGFLVPPAILGLVAERRLRPAALFIALLCGYSVYVGGDAFKNGRFLLAGLPPLTALALSGVERGFGLRHEIGLALGWFAVAALLWPLYGAGSTPALTLAAIVLATRIPAVTARFRWATPGALGGGAIALGALFLNGPTDAGGRELGPLHSARRTAAPPRSLLTDKYVAKQARLVRRAHPPATLVAHTAIGRFGYYSRLRILDVFGLVDAHVARSDSALARAGRGGLLLPGHQRSDSDYVLSREPDFIFIPRRVPALRAHQVPAVLDLWDNPRFKRNYAYEPGVGAYRRRASTPPDRASSP